MRNSGPLHKDFQEIACVVDGGMAVAIIGPPFDAAGPCGGIGRRGRLKKGFVYHIHSFCDGAKV